MEAFPYYLSIGMSYTEYWERDPYLVRAYREAHELYREQKNQEMWMQSLYDYEAFQAVINAFSWGLGGKKGAKPSPYRDYPIPVTERERKAEKQRAIAKTLAWVQTGQAQND